MSQPFTLRKMTTKFNDKNQVQYYLKTVEHNVSMNALVGQDITLNFTGAIKCLNCQKLIKKTYNQGYCFVCLQKLAGNDICQVKPELCHFIKGTCREPEWAKENCFIPHTLYVSNTSGIKVGITRSRHRQSRWCDQGACQALAVLETDQRLHVGLIENHLTRTYADKTNWRNMLKGTPQPEDLEYIGDTILEELEQLSHVVDYMPLEEEQIDLEYPVLEYPTKVQSLSVDKTPYIKGRLMGIKGQYLMLEHGVINLRKYGGYECIMEW